MVIFRIKADFILIRIEFIENIYYKSSQSKEYRLVLVRLVDSLLKPALAPMTISLKNHVICIAYCKFSPTVPLAYINIANITCLSFFTERHI
jgi:hypothetical protein